MVESIKTLLPNKIIFTNTGGGFPDDTVAKNLPAKAGDTGDLGSILESGRYFGVGNGNQLQYSCLENSMDRKEAGGLKSMRRQRVINKYWNLVSTYLYGENELPDLC